MSGALKLFSQLIKLHRPVRVRRLTWLSTTCSANSHGRNVHPGSDAFQANVDHNTPIPDQAPWRLTAEPARARLDALLTLLEAEVRQGRWRAAQSADTESSPTDRLLIGPLSRDLNLPAKSVHRLISFVCSMSDHLLLTGVVCGPHNDASAVRMELLNSYRVVTDLFDPLGHHGIQEPQKLLAKCPALLLASAAPSHSPANSWRGPIPKRATVLLAALDELGSLLARNDLTALLKRFPAVLLRPRHELFQIYTYLTEQMGLQTTDLARSTQMRSHRHFLRHTTGLRLVSCPAWCLPLNQVRARHLLAVLAGCWPPSHSVHLRMTRDQRLAKLLTVPVPQVAHWLGLFSPVEQQPAADPGMQPQSTGSRNQIALTGADVRTFESLIAQVEFDRDDTRSAQQPDPGSPESVDQSVCSRFELLETIASDTESDEE